jgi:hypothetical protein
MDALRNSKKISLLAVAILFLFTFFNLILDAPRTYISVLFLQCTDKKENQIFHIYKEIQSGAVAKSYTV